jgi:hypothetical protein
MARSLFLSLAGLAWSFPHPKKPDFLTIDFVVNFVDGLTNDHHDMQSCILGALQPVGDVVTVVQDAKSAIHDRNYTEFLMAFDALDAFLHDVQPAVATCAVPVQDGKADWKVLSNFSSIKELLGHVKQDFAGDDQDRIMAGFEAAFQAYFQKDYGSFGGDLGAALYRLMISPRYPDEKKKLGSSQEKLPPFLTIDFVVNLLDGLTNDHHDVQACILGSLAPIGDAVAAEQEAKAAIHDRNITEFVTAIKDIQKLLQDIPPAVLGCEVPVQDVKLDFSALANVSSIGDLIRHVESDFAADKKDQILPEFESAFQAYFKEDYGTFGAELGTALYRLLIAAQYPDETVLV